ncbi:MAG: translocation/assembly module TamB [Candidatus Protochlamydia sp.]|nr:translocation/assembly module TamB [Candidatus Protochlamydia sp.]
MKILFKTFLALFLVFALFLIAVLGFLRTERGQQWAVDTMLMIVENQTDANFSADHIDVFFPLGFRAKNISMTSNGKKIAFAEEIEVLCNYWQLLEGKLIFSSIKGRNLNLLSMPSTQSKGEGGFQFQGKALVPFYIKVEKIFFENIWASPSALGELSLPSMLAEKVYHFNVKGSITNNPFKNTLSSQLLIDLAEENGGAAGHALALSLANRHLSLSFHAKEISHQLNIGNELIDFDAAVALSAAGPLNSWLNKMQSDQDTPIEGNFKFIAFPKNERILAATCGQEIVIKGKYTLQSGWMLGIEHFQLACPGMNLSAKGTLSSDFQLQEGSFEGNIEEMETLSPLIKKQLNGILAFNGQASGPLSFPKFFINGTSPALTFQDKTFKNLETTLSAEHIDDGIQGFIKINFDCAEVPCDLASSFQLNGQELLLKELKGAVFESTANGNLSINLNDPLLNGQLEIHSANFQKISAFLDVPFEGSGNAIIFLTHTLDESGVERQNIKSNVTIQDLRWDNLSSKHLSASFTLNLPGPNNSLVNVETHLMTESLLYNDLSAASLALNANHQIDLKNFTFSNFFTQGNVENIEWPDGKAARGFFDIYIPQLPLQNGDIRFSFVNIEANSSLIEEIRGETHVDLNQTLWPFDLEAKGKWKENWTFRLDGQWHIKDTSFDLYFSKLNGFFEGASFFLLNPVALSGNKEDLEISEAHLKWGQMEINVGLKKEKQNLDLQFSSRSINADYLNNFFPDFPVQGAASLKGYLKGPLEDPVGEIQITVHELTVPEQMGVKKTSLSGKVDLALNHSGIDVKSLIYGVGASPLRLYGTLPYHFILSPFALQSISTTPLLLNLEAEGEIDPFVDLFYNDITHLTGHARIALNFTGQLDAPLIKGFVEFENGTYESINSGSLYQNIYARFEGEGTKISLKRLNAENTHGGSISVSGAIELDKKNDFPFEFFIKPKKIFIIESEYANLSATGSLRFFGNKKKSKVEGELSTDTATVDLESALPKQIKSVDFQFINLQKGEETLQPDASKMNSSIEFDIKLNVPNNLMIEGKKLTSKWKGGLMITGTPKSPLLFGDLRVSDGDYKFNGKVFDLTQGTIHFFGSPGKKTSIYVVASKDIGKIRADIIVKGPTNKLTVSFRSSPPLSQREILSYILFNRGISDITPDQGNQLSQSFIELNDTESAGGDDFLTRLRNNMGLDRLEILPQSFQVGKYITEGVFVSIDKTKDVGNRLIIEADVLKNLKAQAEVKLGGEAQQKFSLKWKKDY